MTSTSGGEAIVNGLVAHGVDTVFGLPGAQIYGLFDAFHQAQLKVIGARHEQACGYMAFGYARSTGKPGVFSVVPGPGVLNAGAALLTAFGCNEPVLCLTGQVPTAFLGKGRGHLHEMPDQLGTLRTLREMGRADRISRRGARRVVARVSGNALRPPRPGVAGNAVGRVHAARGGRPLPKCSPRSRRPSPTPTASRPPRPDQGQQAADDLRRQRRDPRARGNPRTGRNDRRARGGVPQRARHRLQRARTRADHGGGLQAVADRPT